MKNTERLSIKQLLSTQEVDLDVNVKAWVRTKRESKNVAFLALNDGSTIHNLQAVVG